MFKTYLQQQEGFENHHPYLWSELESMANELLKNSTSLSASKTCLGKILELKPKIGALKQK